MDVKFQSGFCNYQPSKIECYGAYKFEHAYQLLDIPKLADELFNLVCKPAPKANVEQVEQAYDKKR